MWFCGRETPGETADTEGQKEDQQLLGAGREGQGLIGKELSKLSRGGRGALYFNCSCGYPGIYLSELADITLTMSALCCMQIISQ